MGSGQRRRRFPSTHRLGDGLVVAVLGMMALTTALAQPAYRAGDAAAIRLNYQLYCQGCHAPTGIGSASVPRLEGHMGNFLKSRDGREFLVRVPGAATSVLSDGDLADVLNWMLLEFDANAVPENFVPYTSAEVGLLRQSPLNEVNEYRLKILAEINQTEIE